jgi:hypothetical protein
MRPWLSTASRRFLAKATAFLRADVTKARVLSIHPTAATISLRLAALKINGQRIEVTTNQLESKGASHIKRDVAIGAAAGAGIGAVFGGAMGAAIGGGASRSR